MQLYFVARSGGKGLFIGENGEEVRNFSCYIPRNQIRSYGTHAENFYRR